MIYLNKKEKVLLDAVNKYSCITRGQIARLLGEKYLKSYAIELLVSKGHVKLAGDNKEIVLALMASVDQNLLLANDLIISFINNIDWFNRADFPYLYSFYMNEKIFDVAAITQPIDKLTIHNINNSKSERVIVIVDSERTIAEVNITKPVRYCMFKNSKIKYYIKNGTEIIQE